MKLVIILRTKISIFEQHIAIDVKSVGPLSFGMRVVARPVRFRSSLKI